MDWNYVGISVLFLAIGYWLGSISWAIIFSKTIKNDDIRNHGSGNAGSTNMMRTYGKKIASVVFVLDVLKTVISVLIAYLLDRFYMNGIVELAGLGAIIGHIWPIFFKFKGGKGTATFVGLILTMQWMLIPVGALLFFGIVLKSRMVSLGSITAPIGIIAAQIAFSFIPHMNDNWDAPLSNGTTWWINTIILTVAWLITVWMHRGNIKRIIKGEERTI